VFQLLGGLILGLPQTPYIVQFYQILFKSPVLHHHTYDIQGTEGRQKLSCSVLLNNFVYC